MNMNMSDAEKCLAKQCADYVAGDKHNEAVTLATLFICATDDPSEVVVLLQAFASSVLFGYIQSHQNPEDLTDQLFGKAIQGK